MNDKIKVLFLDIDNTLLDFYAAAAWAMGMCFKKRDLSIIQKCFPFLQRKIIKSGGGSNSEN